MDGRILIQLATMLAPLSILSVGGGQTVVADIHRQTVETLRWMDDGQFLDLFAVSRMAPGPGSLLACLVGWRVAGWPGALVSAIAFFGPSSAVFFWLARLWRRHPDSRLLKAIEEGLAPVSAGLVLASGAVLLRSADGGALAVIIALGSTAGLLTGRIHPFALLGIGAAVFLAFG